MQGSGAVAIGHHAETYSNAGVAIGVQSSINDSMIEMADAAAGYIGKGSSLSDSAIMTTGDARSFGSVAVGYKNTATASQVVGLQNTANIGGAYGAGNTVNYGYALGTENTVVGTKPLGALTIEQTVEKLKQTGSTYAYAVGDRNTAEDNSFVFGSKNTAEKQSIAVGHSNQATGENSMALGNSASALGIQSVAIGAKSSATGHGAVAIGSIAKTTNKTQTVASGEFSYAAQGGLASNVNSIAMGHNAQAIGMDSLALQGGKARGTSSIAIGEGATADAANGVTIGQFTNNSGEKSVALGYGSYAKGNNSFTFGGSNHANDSILLKGTIQEGAHKAIVLGGSTGLNAERSVAIGSDSVVFHSDGIALGAYSEAKTNAGVQGYLSNGATDATWQSTNAAMSIGNGSRVTRQITSLAAGTEDTDAVNVAQLKASTNEIVGILGGNATIAADGNVTMTNIGGTGKDNINDAIAAAMENSTVVTQGDGITVTKATSGATDTYTVSLSDVIKKSISQAQVIADESKVMANNAQNTASEAKVMANNAQNTASEAKTTANQALNEAKVKTTITSKSNNLIVSDDGNHNYELELTGIASNEDLKMVDKKVDKAQTIANNAQNTANEAKTTANQALNEAKVKTTVTSKSNNLIVSDDGNHNYELELTGIASNEDLKMVDKKVDKAQTIANNAQNTANKALTQLKTGLNNANQRMDRIDRSINKNRKRADAGIASVAAMANIPQVITAGKSAIGIGLGNRGGQSAVAIGYSFASDNGKHLIKLSSSFDTQDKVTTGAGYSYQW